ncbi:bifunctional DNA primase/polymerase [Streptomyces sp. NPDC057686]|uniref:bifunctional DNA primase/polymerase n=1 Tax=Streptomyces sp. NPDC057686 TaxID=3346212 RepID=UPI003687F21C
MKRKHPTSPTTKATMIEHAIKAAQKNFHIFPVHPAGTVRDGRIVDKEPMVAWGEAATTNIDQIIEWWIRQPTANIGISCKKSGLLVVDCDIYKQPWHLKGTSHEWIHNLYGPHVDGEDCLRAISERVGADWAHTRQTYRVQTGRMGVHLYYRWPGEIRASQASPVRGLLDVRTNGGRHGGYVLAAGSATAAGPYQCEADLPIQNCPTWLIELVREKLAPPRITTPLDHTGPGNYLGLIQTVRMAHEGNRNQATFWAARCMCADGASQTVCEQLLTEPARIVGLTDREIFSTIRSAYRAQTQKKEA